MWLLMAALCEFLARRPVARRTPRDAIRLRLSRIAHVWASFEVRVRRRRVSESRGRHRRPSSYLPPPRPPAGHPPGGQARARLVSVGHMTTHLPQQNVRLHRKKFRLQLDGRLGRVISVGFYYASPSSHETPTQLPWLLAFRPPRCRRLTPISPNSLFLRQVAIRRPAAADDRRSRPVEARREPSCTGCGRGRPLSKSRTGLRGSRLLLWDLAGSGALRAGRGHGSCSPGAPAPSAARRRG